MATIIQILSNQEQRIKLLLSGTRVIHSLVNNLYVTSVDDLVSFFSVAIVLQRK